MHCKSSKNVLLPVHMLCIKNLALHIGSHFLFVLISQKPWGPVGPFRVSCTHAPSLPQLSLACPGAASSPQGRCSISVPSRLREVESPEHDLLSVICLPVQPSVWVLSVTWLPLQQRGVPGRAGQRWAQSWCRRSSSSEFTDMHETDPNFHGCLKPFRNPEIPGVRSQSEFLRPTTRRQPGALLACMALVPMPLFFFSAPFQLH